MAGRQNQTALVNVLVISGLVTAALCLWVLVQLDGWTYYTTPIGVRGYAPQHPILKPSGAVAHPLGVLGVLMMFVPVVYVLRKRVKALARAGSISTWLEVHVFCGIVGPIFVTFHTAFRFSGIISVAYWSMTAVMLSGFVGRYLYVRIPKSIRGVEMSHDEVQARAEELAARLGRQGVDRAVLEKLSTSGVLSAARLRHLRVELVRQGIDRRRAREVVAIARERSLLLKRLGHLHRTKNLFAAWHVFHQPLVYVMFAIAALHVGVALYFGYSWW